ncbi:hypothetical protein HGRIS_011019 [Hohenbuehelia grisea]|uniref:PIPK domain-containing protein n=1 Tax=Hohenbuehelia grisea TaxID=104357 RepID=A0ABR3IYY7_9AGAR
MAGAEKPLPGLPSNAPTPTTLSIQARRHRLRFIRQVLNEDSAQSAFGDDARDAWAHALEDALDELSTSITRGGWLSGIRRARAARSAKLLSSVAAANALDINKELTDTKATKETKETKEVKASKEAKEVKGSKDVKDGSSKAVEQGVPESGGLGEPSAMTLRRIKDLVAQSIPPGPKGVPKRLLLCLAPLGSRISVPKQQVAFPDSISCLFTAGTFTLPDEDLDEQGSQQALLFGVDQWDAGILSPEDGPARLVGGTFSFKGVTSPVQHHILARALHVAAYVHLSLILDQHFLSSSHVHLLYPKPRMPSTSLSFQPNSSSRQPEPPPMIDKARSQGTSFLPSATGILSFFTKRAGLQRSNSSGPLSAGRGGSLDLGRPAVGRPSTGRSATPERSSRISQDDKNSSPLRRFSFMQDPRPSFMKPAPTEPVDDHPDPVRPFAMALKRIEGSKDLLSTSVGVIFDPPSLLVQLAEKERQFPDRRLKGDERTALTSILGWEGKESKGKGMAGLTGFVRQQGFSVLSSYHVPSAISPLHPPESSIVSAATSIASASTLSAASKSSKVSNTSTSTESVPKATYGRCGSPKWLTYQYYTRDHRAGADKCLGEAIAELVICARMPCERAPACSAPRGAHERRLIHGGVCITVNVDAPPGAAFPNELDYIEAWQSCVQCGASTDRVPLSDGAYLLSFGKFLELLVYSPKVIKLTPALCEHTSPSSSSTKRHSTLKAEPNHIPSTLPLLPDSRLNIVRHFSCQGSMVTFRLSCIDDIYEIRVPRLQILRGYGDKPAREPTVKEQVVGTVDEEKKALRREIKTWWEAVSDHMDKLEEILNDDETEFFRKALPRLPSVDDSYYEGEGEEEQTPLPKTPLTPTPIIFIPTTPMTPTNVVQISNDRAQREYFNPRKAPSVSSSFSESSSVTSSTASSSSHATDPPIQLLARLRHTFQTTEQSLYTQLTKTPVTSLNDVRRAFLSSSKGASKRLLAWQRKHLPSDTAKAQIGDCIVATEPEWWAKGCHAVPGGHAIVRENDWGSIIAYTLGSMDFQRELANMSVNRVPSARVSPPPPSTPVVLASSNAAAAGTSFFATPARGFNLFSGSNRNTQPDADQEDVVWHEPESFSAVISRKQHPRDATYLLSLRDVLRQKSPIDGSPAGLPSALLNTLAAGATGMRSPSGPTPPLAWAKPDVQVSMQAADGHVVIGSSSAGGTSPGALDTPESEAGKILQEIESAELSRPGSAMAGSVKASRPASVASSQDGRIRRSQFRRASASSDVSSKSDATIGPETAETGSAIHLDPPALPPKEGSPTAPQAISAKQENIPAPSPSSFTNTITTSLNYAMRLVTGSEQPLDPRSGSPMPKHHGLLSADVSNIDERPHIKYDWTVGNRLKFSCTVYYAKQFDLLRRRCGLEDVFLKSMARSANWAAEGGKSKSNFWKTSDDRFIIKTLVNAWNVADLQVLLELAPSYFRYMEFTASRATVLAKLLGFYTIEIRNLESGNVQAKADLLVMENLFYDQKVVKTFDLKGIQGRKVKSGSADGGHEFKTLFDGEWIEGQQRTLTLVRPHSKVILKEAIKNDAEFLSRSNIMDYSLLLGVDEEHKQIACGLVDTIGSYTFAKTLEYKAKQGLNSGKDVTVVPPTEYQERFVSALDGYFLACPDKWSQPMDDVKISGDANLLPSVL